MSESHPPRRPPLGDGKSGATGSGRSPSAKRKPAFEVVEDEPAFEVVDEQPKPAIPVAKKARRAEPDPEADDDREPKPEQPRRKKKKKGREKSLSDQLLEGEKEDQARREAALRHFEYTTPSVLLVIGVVLSVIGALGASKGVSGIFTIAVLSAFIAIYVPLAIGVLMVVGLAMGINYGRLWPALLKMTAITFIVNGIWLLGEWMRLPWFLIFPISCFISFGLFMTQFDLDTWEANASVGALNVLTFVANLILIGFLVIAAASTSHRGSEFDDDDSPPAETQPDRKKKRDKDRGENMKGQANPGSPPPVLNPDDDDDN